MARDSWSEDVSAPIRCPAGKRFSEVAKQRPDPRGRGRWDQSAFLYGHAGIIKRRTSNGANQGIARR